MISRSKGAVLEDFIEAIKNGTLPNLEQPQSILFIDDLLTNINMVRIACEKLDIDCYAVHLTTVEDGTKNHDPDELEIMGCIQDHAMKNSYPIPTDAEILLGNAMSGGSCPISISLYYE